VTCGRLVVFSRYSGFLHQYNRLPRYNNIVESGVKHITLILTPYNILGLLILK
jgi:hypothetical protein